MPLNQNPHQTVTRLHTRQYQNELHLKRWFFLPKSAFSVSRSQSHLAMRKRIGCSIVFNSWSNWTLYGIIPRSLCKIRLNDDSKMCTCWERRPYSRVYALFLAFHALVYRWGCQFLLLFWEDNKHIEVTVFLFFQNPYVIFIHILQHYHDFQSNVAIFPSVVQAYTQSYSFGGRIKLINCQNRHELPFTK